MTPDVNDLLSKRIGRLLRMGIGSNFQPRYIMDGFGVKWRGLILSLSGRRLLCHK